MRMGGLESKGNFSKVRVPFLYPSGYTRDPYFRNAMSGQTSLATQRGMTDPHFWASGFVVPLD